LSKSPPITRLEGTITLLLLLLPALLSLLIGGALAESTYGTVQLAQFLAAGVEPGAAIPQSPIFLLLFTLLDRSGLPLIPAALLLGGAGWGFAAGVVYHKGEQPFAALITAVLLASNPLLPAAAAVESGWVLGVALLAWSARQKELDGVWILLLPLLRLEAGGLLLAMLLARRRRTVLLKVVGLSALLGATIWWWLGETAVRAALFTLPKQDSWQPLASLVTQSELYLLLIPLILLGIWRLTVARRTEAAAAAALPLFFGAGDLAAAAIVTSGALLTGHGIHLLLHWLERAQPPARNTQVWRGRLAALLLLPLLMAQGTTLYRQLTMQPRQMQQLEAAAAEWVQAHSAPDALLLAPPAVGVRAARPIWGDYARLQTAALPALLDELIQRPPQIILSDGRTAWDYLTATGWFRERYRAVRQLQAADERARLTIWMYQPGPFDRGAYQPLQVAVANGVHLVGARYWPEQIGPGEAVHLTLYWQADTAVTDPFQVVARLDSPVDQVAWAQRDEVRPFSLPLDWWQPDQVIPERFVLTTTGSIPPGVFRLSVSTQELGSEEFVPMFQDGNENALDRVTLGYALVPWKSEPTGEPVGAAFGEVAQLAGAALPAAAAAGETVPVSLTWEALNRPEADYIVFLHLLNGNGEWQAGDDRRPQSGQFNTLGWLPGALIPDTHYLTLPDDLPPGEYDIFVGLYRPDTGERLPAQAVDGTAVPDGAYPLGRIEVSE